jgi:hypothetical protein
MDAETLNRWRGLHFRVACGETLTPDEEQFYRAALRELEQGDPIGAASVARLQELRKAVAALEEALRERSRELLSRGD